MKELTKDGVGIHRNRADLITREDEEHLWESGTLNLDTAKGLSYAVNWTTASSLGLGGGGG